MLDAPRSSSDNEDALTHLAIVFLEPTRGKNLTA